MELRLHRKGLETALEAGRSCGCHLTVSGPEELDLPSGVERKIQVGRTFGERLVHTLRDARRDRPAAPVVVVGSDVPGLTESHLQCALALLEEDEERVVVGPSPDGGFYLLASRRPVEEILAGVRWRRSDTLASLLDGLATAGRPVTLLPPLADLDSRADMERWLADPDAAAGSWSDLCRLLRSILSTLRRPAAIHLIGDPRGPVTSSPSARAPPG